ncbi:MAG: hypothetical protein ABI969_05345 [bacterium]
MRVHSFGQISRFACIVAAACVLVVLPAVAQDAGSKAHGTTISMGSAGDSTAHVVSRLPLKSAAFSIVSEDGRSALLLMDTTIVAQLTDRGLSALHQSADSAAKSDKVENVFARMVAGAVMGALKPMLDHGVAYHLRDLGSAQYESGRLMLRNKAGKEVFGKMSINGKDVMESFSPQDAREFARRAKAASVKLLSS